MKIRLEFKLQDAWIGVFWRSDEPYWRPTHPPQFWERKHVWVCLVPMFPLHLSWEVCHGTALEWD